MTISVVQTLKVPDTWSGNFASSVTAGNTIFLVVTAYSTVNAVMSSSSPLYNGVAVTGATQLVSINSPNTASGKVYTSIWMLPNVSGAHTAVSITVTGQDASPNPGAIGLIAYEVAGLGTTPTLDKSNTSSGDSTGLTSGASGAITAAPEFVLGSLVIFGVVVTPAGAPWTELQLADAFSVAGYQIPTSSGGSFTYSASPASSQDWCGGIVTVKGTSSAHTDTAALTVTPTETATRTHAATDTAALTVTPTETATRTHAATDTAALTVTPTETATAAAGAPQLVISIASVAGTDPATGTHYDPGVSYYGASGSKVSMTSDGTHAEVTMLPPGPVTANTLAPQMRAQALNVGLAGETILTVLTSGKESGNADAALQLFSASADNTTTARAILEFGGAIVFTLQPTVLQLTCPVQPGNGTTPGANIYSGSGAPGISGTTGDLYIRTDGGAGTYLYRCTGGSAWTAFA